MVKNVYFMSIEMSSNDKKKEIKETEEYN